MSNRGLIAGRDLVKRFEGFRKRPYLDCAGIITIGYGTTRYPNGEKVEYYDDAVTEDEAQNFLVCHLDYINCRVLKDYELTGNQRAALLSFIYNVGEQAFKDSTMCKLIKAGDFANAANEFDKWIYAGGKKSKGLINRRAKEKEIFLKG